MDFSPHEYPARFVTRELVHSKAETLVGLSQLCNGHIRAAMVSHVRISVQIRPNEGSPMHRESAKSEGNMESVGLTR
jgi:hypothetical protein